MSVERALDDLRTGTATAVAEAVSQLQHAAKARDPEASRHLATLAAAGIGMPQSWARALTHLFAAALAGSASARGQLAILSGREVAAELADHTAEHWRQMCASAHIEDWLEPCDKRVLNASPRVVAVEGFLRPAVCDWLIGLARDRLAPALTYGADGAAALTSDSRSNSACQFGITETDVVMLLTRQRVAATIGVPAAALETSQVLHYSTGERFAPHHDYLDPGLADVARNGQRIVTFLIYLNDAFAGGETVFQRLGLNHRGATGGALYFGNLDQAGAPDPRTLHAGLAPTSGEKWVFSQWIRDRAWV